MFVSRQLLFVLRVFGINVWVVSWVANTLSVACFFLNFRCCECSCCLVNFLVMISCCLALFDLFASLSTTSCTITSHLCLAYSCQQTKHFCGFLKNCLSWSQYDFFFAAFLIVGLIQTLMIVSVFRKLPCKILWCFAQMDSVYSHTAETAFLLDSSTWLYICW